MVGLDIEQIEGVKTPSIEPKGSCYFEDLLDNLHDSLLPSSSGIFFCFHEPRKLKTPQLIKTEGLVRRIIWKHSSS